MWSGDLGWREVWWGGVGRMGVGVVEEEKREKQSYGLSFTFNLEPFLVKVMHNSNEDMS